MRIFVTCECCGISGWSLVTTRGTFCEDCGDTIDPETVIVELFRRIIELEKKNGMG